MLDVAYTTCNSHR